MRRSRLSVERFISRTERVAGRARGQGRVNGARVPGTGTGTGTAGVLLFLALASLAGFTGLMLLGHEPFATWYYLFAWFPTLVAADAVVALLGAAGPRGSFLLLSRPRHLLSVLGWSSVIWLFYELFNLRLQNWYYVLVPEDRVVRWAFTVIAFATVLPAVFLSERILRGLRVAWNVRWKPLRMTAPRLHGIQLVGLVFLVLVLAWPRYFFPLVWGATTLIIEPIVYRRAPDRSILGDLEKGEPGRLLRLLLGGMAIGLFWELFNIRARAKWIYTVPGLEDVKLFEMPVLGFFGFPPFAVECFVLWQALVIVGAAVPGQPDARFPTRSSRRVLAATLGVVFSAAILFAMEGRTWDSFRPALADIVDSSGAALRDAGYDAFELARANTDQVARVAGVERDRAESWIRFARLATLRGIGATNARQLQSIGIHDVETLARVDANELIARLDAIRDRPVVPARIRVWLRAARAAAERDG